MFYKKRFIRNLVIFGEFHCSNSDVTRFLYVVKWETSPFLAVFLINHTACTSNDIILAIINAEWTGSWFLDSQKNTHWCCCTEKRVCLVLCTKQGQKELLQQALDATFPILNHATCNVDIWPTAAAVLEKKLCQGLYSFCTYVSNALVCTT